MKNKIYHHRNECPIGTMNSDLDAAEERKQLEENKL